MPGLRVEAGRGTGLPKWRGLVTMEAPGKRPGACKPRESSMQRMLSGLLLGLAVCPVLQTHNRRRLPMPPSSPSPPQEWWTCLRARWSSIRRW